MTNGVSLKFIKCCVINMKAFKRCNTPGLSVLWCCHLIKMNYKHMKILCCCVSFLFADIKAGNLSCVHVSQQHEMEFRLWSTLTSGINQNCSYCDIVREPKLSFYCSTGKHCKIWHITLPAHKLWHMGNLGVSKNTRRVWASAPPWGTKWYSIEV